MESGQEICKRRRKMPFPLIKLGYLALKHISKPLANGIKMKAKSTPFLRNRILLPAAQRQCSYVSLFSLDMFVVWSYEYAFILNFFANIYCQSLPFLYRQKMVPKQLKSHFAQCRDRSQLQCTVDFVLVELLIVLLHIRDMFSRGRTKVDFTFSAVK